MLSFQPPPALLQPATTRRWHDFDRSSERELLPAPSPQVTLHHLMFPDIFHAIVTAAPVPVLLALRRTSRCVKVQADAILRYRHIELSVDSVHFEPSLRRLQLSLSVRSTFTVSPPVGARSNAALPLLPFPDTELGHPSPWLDMVRQHTTAVDLVVSHALDRVAHTDHPPATNLEIGMKQLASIVKDIFSHVESVRHDCPRLPRRMFPHASRVVERRYLATHAPLAAAPSVVAAVDIHRPVQHSEPQLPPLAAPGHPAAPVAAPWTPDIAAHLRFSHVVLVVVPPPPGAVVAEADLALLLQHVASARSVTIVGLEALEDVDEASLRRAIHDVRAASKAGWDASGVSVTSSTSTDPVSFAAHRAFRNALGAYSYGMVMGWEHALGEYDHLLPVE